MENSGQEGGQPGNKNALKHGFYAKSFTLSETDDLEAIKKQNLEGEINMLRVSLRRTFELATHADDLEDACAALSALGQTSIRLAGLLKTQWLLQGNGAVELTTALNKVLSGEDKDLSCKS